MVSRLLNYEDEKKLSSGVTCATACRSDETLTHGTSGNSATRIHFLKQIFAKILCWFMWITEFLLAFLGGGEMSLIQEKVENGFNL